MFSQNEVIETIYLIPGQGADHRLFNTLELEGDYELIHLQYKTPEANLSLKEYAYQMAEQIDTSRSFALIGVSLGGMIACEIAQLTNPTKTIIISSAKSRSELPRRYTFQQKYPLYKMVGPNLAKFGSKVLQPLVEPDRNNEKETFKSMLAAKDPVFLKRTIGMIINWERTEVPENIIHIHGDKDKTIPLKNVKADYIIHGGSHMMTLTEGHNISAIINDLLVENNPTYQ